MDDLKNIYANITEGQFSFFGKDKDESGDQIVGIEKFLSAFMGFSKRGCR